MNITPETVAAVNAVLRGRDYVTADGATYRVNTDDLDADDVQALLLALAKCEPVRGLVEACESTVGYTSIRDDGTPTDFGVYYKMNRVAGPFRRVTDAINERDRMITAALAPFQGGDA